MFFPVLFCRFQILCQLRDELRKNSIIIMEVQKQPVEIPEKIIGEIAEWLDCGMVCFLNPETGKVETTLGPSYDDYYAMDEDEEDSLEAEALSRIDSWERVVRIDSPESWESFQIMEGFVEQALPEECPLRSSLARALKGRKPFSHFKSLVDDSEYRSLWFDFKHKQLVELVRGRVIDALSRKYQSG